MKIGPKIRKRWTSNFNDWQSRIQRRNEFQNIHESLALLYYSMEDLNKGTEFLMKYKQLVNELSVESNLVIKREESLLKLPSDAVNLEDQGRIELATKQQSQSSLWNDLRAGRITASKAGYCYRMTPELITPAKLWRSVPLNSAMAHGREFEPLGIEALSKLCNLNIQDSGFWIDTERPWLGATPDGLIYNDENALEAVVEIKCPYSAKMDKIDNWKTSSNSCLGPDGKLKPKHDYYYQIQMQMAITNTKKSLFGIYTGIDLYSEWIEFDQLLWNDMLVKFDLIWQHLQTFNKDAKL